MNQVARRIQEVGKVPEKAAKRKSHSFLQGALILSAGTMLVKLIGAIFKIPLTNMIGELGMGYFNTAYQIYMPIYTIATAGFPIAVSKMVSQNMALGRYRDVRQVYKTAGPFFFLSGLAGFLIMYFGAGPYTAAVQSPNALFCIRMMAPTVFFCCMMSVHRGYYEGMRNMTPTAVSQVIEAVCKLFIGLLGAYLVMQAGMREYAAEGTVFGAVAADAEAAVNLTLPFAAAGAISGVTVGSVLGFLFLWLRHRIKGDGITQEELRASPVPESRRRTMGMLLRISVPVCIGALVINLGSLIDVTFLQNRLGAISPGTLRILFGDLIPSSIHTGELTPYLYGCYTIAQNVAALVPTVAQSFGVSALPSVTAAWAGGDKVEIKKNVDSVVRLSSLIAFPAGLGIIALAGPILRLLFSQRPNGVLIATPLLAVLGVTVILMTISVPVNSMLQAVGRADLPVKLLSIGMLIKLALNYTLVAVPQINLMGACIGSVACYLFITVFGVYCLGRQTRVKLDYLSAFVKPLLAGVACAACAWGAQGLIARVLPDKVATLAAVAVAVIVYIAVLLLVRAVTKEDILMLPKGEKLAGFLEKHHFLR